MRKRSFIFYNIIGVVLFILCWELIYIVEKNPAIPCVDKIFNSIVNIVSDSKFYSNLLSTLKLVVIGVTMATVFGVSLAFVMSLNDNINRIISPVIECLRNIPAITLFPMLLVIYGIGDFSRIFVIFWTAYPSIIIQTYYGLTNIDKTLIEASENLGATKLQTYRYVRFPLALVEILNGVRIAIGAGFIAIVVAEMLGATKGLGYMILWCTNAFKYPDTYGYIVIVALIGGVINYLMNILIKKYERKVK